MSGSRGIGIGRECTVSIGLGIMVFWQIETDSVRGTWCSRFWGWRALSGVDCDVLFVRGVSGEKPAVFLVGGIVSILGIGFGLGHTAMAITFSSGNG